MQNLPEDILFQATDLKGRTVICTRDRWLFHILDHHPDMEGYEKDVMKAIESGIVYVDPADDSHDVYFCQPPHERVYVMVIVGFVDSKMGRVITAYRATRLKSMEPRW